MFSEITADENQSFSRAATLREKLLTNKKVDWTSQVPTVIVLKDINEKGNISDSGCV